MSLTRTAEQLGSLRRMLGDELTEVSLHWSGDHTGVSSEMAETPEERLVESEVMGQFRGADHWVVTSEERATVSLQGS